MIQILIVIIICGLAIGLPLGFKYLVDKKLISQESLLFTINLFKLSTQITQELNLSQEKEINQITNIVISSLNYIYSIENLQEKRNGAIAYCIDMCMQLGIEVTNNRLDIITCLVNAGIQDNSK